MLKSKLPLSLLILTFHISTLLYAQDSSVPLHLEKEQLNENDLIKTTFDKRTRLISASRSEKELKDIPSTVYVVTKEEILENGFITLVDVLKTVPWIKVSQPGGGLLGEMFLMRGQIGNEYTKILVNNIPIQPIVTGGIPIEAQLPIAQAERIEIVYGPSSAVYGADAVAGVINIITQTAEKSAYAQANAATGTGGLRHIDFLAGGKAGRDKNVLQYSIYGNITDRNDLPINKSDDIYDPVEQFLREFPEDGNIRNILSQLAIRSPDSFTNIVQTFFPFYRNEEGSTRALIEELPQFSYLIGVKFNYRNFQASFEEMYRRTHSALGRDPFAFAYHSPETYVGDVLRRTTLSYQKDTDKYNLLLNGSFLNYSLDPNSSFGVNYDIGNNIGRAYKYESSDDLFLEGVYTRKFSPKLELTGGVSFISAFVLPQTNDLRSSFNIDHYTIGEGVSEEAHQSLMGDFGFNEGFVLAAGAFFQGFYTSDKLTVVAGMRAEQRTETYGDEAVDYAAINPRISFLYQINPKLSLRTTFANAFRAPAPSTKFTALALPDTEGDSILYQQVPNPAIEPEKSSNFEAGVRYFPSKRISIDVTAFLSRNNSPIVGRSVPLDREEYPLAVSFANVAQARVFLNDPSSSSSLYGIQGIVKMKDIVPSIKLDTDVFFSFTRGNEVLPNEEGEINTYRMQPDFMGQWRISLRPSKRWYLNFQNVLMGSWYRRNIATLDEFEQDNSLIEGFYTLDALARYSFNRNVSAYFRMNNVFNQNYGGIGTTGLDIDLDYNPQLLRNVQLGLSFRIN